MPNAIPYRDPLAHRIGKDAAQPARRPSLQAYIAVFDGPKLPWRRRPQFVTIDGMTATDRSSPCGCQLKLTRTPE